MDAPSERSSGGFRLNWRISRTALVILILGGLIRVCYFSYTSPFTRTYDVQGHIDFVDYINRTGSLPHHDKCFECYHPPLYYLLAVPVAKGFSTAGGRLDARALQVLSLLLSVAFLYVSALFVEALTSDSRVRAMFMALVCFWPAGILHSTRIGNDSLFVTFYAIAFYFYLQWERTGHKANLISAAVFSVLDLLTKANGIILFGLALAMLTRDLLQARNLSPLKKWGESLFVLGVGIVLMTTWTVYNRQGVTASNVVVGNADNFYPGLLVKKDFWAFATFDPFMFLKFPDFDPYSDGRGREYFWNCMFRTSLLGEFRVPDLLHARLSLAINFFFLVLLILLVIGARTLIDDRRAFFLLSSNLALSVLALMAIRFAKPIACSNDFRYILPSLMSSCAFMSYSTKSRHRLVTQCATLSFAAFAMLSLLYFLFPLPY